MQARNRDSQTPQQACRRDSLPSLPCIEPLLSTDEVPYHHDTSGEDLGDGHHERSLAKERGTTPYDELIDGKSDDGQHDEDRHLPRT